MPKVNKYYSSGFTLVELLVVISIIAILSLIGITVYTQTEVTSRDNRRLADLKQVQSALEQYHNDTGYYPAYILNFDGGGQVSATITNPVSGEDIINIYLNILPRDPQYPAISTHKDYKYLPRPNAQYIDTSNIECTTASPPVPGGLPPCTDYCIYAQMEVAPSNTDSVCLSIAFKAAAANSGYNYAVRKGTSF